MRILYVAHGHFWGSTWPYVYIDNYITETLKQLGQEVEIIDFFKVTEQMWPQILEIAKAKQLNEGQRFLLMEELVSAQVLKSAAASKPDLILHIVGRLTSRVLEACKKLGIKTAIWFLDDPYEIDTTSKKALNYDYVFTVESAALDAYKEAGSKNVNFLPLGCFPSEQKIMAVEDKYKSDICFVGVAFPERIEFFDSLADFFKDYKIKIVGGGPNVGSNKDPWLWQKKLKRLDVYKDAILDEMIFPDEAAKYYNGAKINLNVHRVPQDVRFAHANKRNILPKSVNGRTFEIAGCAGFQLIDNFRSDVSLHFEVGKEIVTFSDKEDLKNKIKYYLGHEPERRAIGNASQAKAYAKHTYSQRLKKLLEICGK